MTNNYICTNIKTSTILSKSYRFYLSSVSIKYIVLLSADHPIPLDNEYCNGYSVISILTKFHINKISKPISIYWS